MAPEEICRRLGEQKTKSIFLELTAEAMKKVLREAKIPTNRLASHTSTRKRNDDWAGRVWRTVLDKPAATTAATLLFEWLTRTRRPMLGSFLSALDVPHEDGLTDADFMQTSAPEKLLEAGKKLFEQHDKAEVAAYLLFLDASNKSEIFAPLELEKYLLTPAAA
ncbi:MAG: hypothetical protein JWM53_4408 [bacterium]|nr:hypothetical protein [bacterium]